MANFPGLALRLYALNLTAPITISSTGKTYFEDGTGDYSATFPANFFAQPRLVHIYMRGIYSIPALSAATLNVGVDIIPLGGTASSLAEVGSFTPVSITGSKGWMLDEMVNSQGGSTLSTPCVSMPNGFAGFSTAALGAAVSVANFVGINRAASITVDTTKAMTLKPWAQFGGTISAGTSVTLQIFAVEASE